MRFIIGPICKCPNVDYRSTSAAAMANAYATVVDFATIFHIVQKTGDFGPGIIAQEYDNLVTGLFPLLGYNPVVFLLLDGINRPLNGLLLISYWWIIPLLSPLDISEIIHMLLIIKKFRFEEYIVFDPNSSLINLGYTEQDPNADTMFTITTAAIPATTICFGFIFPACNITNSSGYNYLLDTDFTTPEQCLEFLLSFLPHNRVLLPKEVIPHHAELFMESVLSSCRMFIVRMLDLYLWFVQKLVSRHVQIVILMPNASI